MPQLILLTVQGQLKMGYLLEQPTLTIFHQDNKKTVIDYKLDSEILKLRVKVALSVLEEVLVKQQVYFLLLGLYHTN